MPRTELIPIRKAKPPVDFALRSSVAPAHDALMSGELTTTPCRLHLAPMNEVTKNPLVVHSVATHKTLLVHAV
jgi:hypothetical protein